MSHRYSKEYENCIENSGGTTNGIVDCINVEMKKIELEIEKISSELFAKIPKEKSNALDSALKGWRQFLNFGSIAMYDMDMGTMERINTAEWYLSENARMLEWLEDIAHKYEVR